MIEIKNLHYSYGKITALRGINLAANSGEITAIIGANGAGKSTLMKCIAGLRDPLRWGKTAGGAAQCG